MSNPSNPVNPAAAAPTQAAPAQAAPTPTDPILTGKPTLPSARRGTLAPKAPEPVKAAPAPETAPPTPTETRRFKVKVDGVEQVLEESELVRMAQQAGSANKRWESASKMRKDTEQVLELLSKNPHAALETILGSPAAVRAFYEDRLMEQVRADSMSPAEKAQAAQAEKLRAYEAKEKAEREAAAKAKHAAQEQAYMSHYDRLFTAALEKSGLPKTPASIARLARMAQAGVRKGIELSVDDLARHARTEWEGEHNERLKGYKTAKGDIDGEKLLAALGGPEIEAALRRALVKKLKASGLPQAARATPSATMDRRRSETPVQQKGDWASFRRRNRGYTG